MPFAPGLCFETTGFPGLRERVARRFVQPYVIPFPATSTRRS